MDIDRICMACMKEKNSSLICNHCGFDSSSFVLEPLYLKPKTILNGKYLVGNGIGSGGFGITYVGLDLNLDFKVAIKEYMPRSFAIRKAQQTNITPLSNQEHGKYNKGLKKFLDEAKTLAKFNSSNNIIGVRDFFTENGTAYIVMDFLEGCDLSSYAKTLRRPLTYDEITSLLGPCFDALNTVHSSGVLHRDISPDNIYITKNGQPILIDFGAARQFINQNDGLSIILKPGYAPEEQYRRQGKQGPYTDVYALGATIYHMMVGKTPQDSLERLEMDRLIPPSNMGVNIPSIAEKALMKAMAVRSKDRYQTIMEFKNGFFIKSQLQTGKNILARSAGYLDGKDKETKNKKYKKDVYYKEIKNLTKRLLFNIKSIFKGVPNAKCSAYDFKSKAKFLIDSLFQKIDGLIQKIDGLSSDKSRQSIILIRILVLSVFGLCFLLIVAFISLFFVII